MEFADYKNQALSDLRSYAHLRSRAEALSRQVNMLTETGGISCDKFNVSSGISAVSNDVSRLEQLQQELNGVNFRIICIESSLNALDDADRDIITSFYITRQRNTVNTLARKNFTDRSCIYRRAQKALDRYIYACFGVTKTR